MAETFSHLAEPLVVSGVLAGGQGAVGSCSVVENSEGAKGAISTEIVAS